MTFSLSPKIAFTPWRAWIWAARPMTLTASFVPVLVGTFLVWTFGKEIHWLYASLCALFAFSIQIATNLINDALDFKQGADTTERIGPVKVVQMGIFTPAQVLRAGFLFLGLSLFFAIPLLLKGGLWLAPLAFLAILMGYLYTGGPYPLAYTGLSNPFVVIFFGWVAVLFSFYIQTGFFDSRAFLAGTQVGFLATSLHAINNLRDRVGDAKAGKKTLAVRFGVLFARCEISFFILVPFLIGLFWSTFNMPLSWVFPTMTLPLAVFVLREVWTVEPSPKYNQILALSALLHLMFGSFLALSFILHTKFL